MKKKGKFPPIAIALFSDFRVLCASSANNLQFTAAFSLVTDRVVPGIGQKKWVFKSNFNKVFLHILLCNLHRLFDDFSKFQSTMKESLVQFVLNSFLPMALPKPETQIISGTLTSFHLFSGGDKEFGSPRICSSRPVRVPGR